MRIIINALSGIGDAVMFSPALALLKKYIPEAEIDMLVMFNQVKEIYENDPNINNIYFINFLNQSALKSLSEVLKLRKNKYDISINVYPSNRLEYNFISFLENAKKRIATKYNNYSFKNFHFLNNTLVKETKNRHNVIENFYLVKKLIPEANENQLEPLNINLNKDALIYAEDYIRKNNLHNKMLIGFHAGSATFKGHIKKRWHHDKYRETAKYLNTKYNAEILLFGTENDVNEIIKNDNPYIHIPAAKNISESLAIMKYCSLFISNDTALMHLAAALQIPTIAIFAYTNYKELYPWKNEHIIVRKELDCSPCFFNSPRPVLCIRSEDEKFICIRNISIDEVANAIYSLIKKVPGKSEA